MKWKINFTASVLGSQHSPPINYGTWLIRNYLIRKSIIFHNKHLILYREKSHSQIGSEKHETMSAGIPVKLLSEAQGHVVSLELNSGETYRGKLVECEY